MHAIDVTHAAAAVTAALLFLRIVQSLVEHYFPGSGASVAMRFIYGGTQ